MDAADFYTGLVAGPTRRTQVRYEREVPGGEVEALEREWIIHWQTRDSLRELCQTAGLTAESIDDDAGEPDQPGNQFTAVLTLAR